VAPLVVASTERLHREVSSRGSCAPSTPAACLQHGTERRTGRGALHESDRAREHPQTRRIDPTRTARPQSRCPSIERLAPTRTAIDSPRTVLDDSVTDWVSIGDRRPTSPEPGIVVRHPFDADQASIVPPTEVHVQLPRAGSMHETKPSTARNCRIGGARRPRLLPSLHDHLDPLGEGQASALLTG
jgi:hypothetical protein